MAHIYGNSRSAGPAVKNIFQVVANGRDISGAKSCGGLEDADNTIRYHTGDGEEHSYPNGSTLTEFTVVTTDPEEVALFKTLKDSKEKFQMTISKNDANKIVVKTWEFEECNVQKITDEDNDAETVDQLEGTTIAIIGRCVDITV